MFGSSTNSAVWKKTSLLNGSEEPFWLQASSGRVCLKIEIFYRANFLETFLNSWNSFRFIDGYIGLNDIYADIDRGYCTVNYNSELAN